MNVLRTNYRGRKAKIGGICFDEGRMCFFLGYHTCPESHSKHKILLTIDEAREFGKKFGYNKIPLKTKIVNYLIKKYS